MECYALKKELNIGEDHDGIMVLDDKLKVGDDLL